MSKSGLSRATKLLDYWGSPGMERLARWLVLAASATLFLDSAATFQVVYTVRPSYVLFAAALVVGLPSVVRGWTIAPRSVQASGAALLLTYLAATALGHPAVLPDAVRAGSSRSLLYLSDVIMGLGVLGLVVGLWAGRSVRPLLLALAAGATLAAAYGFYQWFAQRYGLPLSNLDNVLASNGSQPDASQGLGLLNWERVRGTFLEPHFLGAYLVALLPVMIAVALWTKSRWRLLAGLAVAVCAAVIALTDSVPSWAALTVSALVITCVFALSSGRKRLAAMAAAMAAAGAIAAPLLLIYPQSLASVTGRNPVQLTLTASARTATWKSALKIWEGRPVLGYGPGQSSVQLTLRMQGRNSSALGSAQGVWAASLIDTGALGLVSLLGLLGAIWFVSAKRIMARPSSVRLCALCAVTAALIAFQFTGDSLELWVWALLGLLLAEIARPDPSGDLSADWSTEPMTRVLSTEGEPVILPDRSL